MNRFAIGVVAALLIGAGCGSSNSVIDGGAGGRAGSSGTDAGSDGAKGGAGGAADARIDTSGNGGATGAGGGATDSGIDATGSGGEIGSGGATGAGGDTGSGGTGSGGAVDAGAVIVTCPTTIDGVLATTDPTQTGRESRVPAVGVCGAPKGFPSNAADPSNPHLFNAYRFVNPAATAACFSFTLTYDGTGGVQRYLTAYSTYDPTNIGNGYLGDVGDVLTSPQTMSITVPAASSIDVVVFGIAIAPAGAGSYTLRCDTGGGGTDGGAETGGGGGADGGGNDGAAANDGSASNDGPPGGGADAPLDAASEM